MVMCWKNKQEASATCHLNPTEYPAPYPIIKLELYGFNAYQCNPDGPKPGSAGPALIPNVLDNGHIRPVRVCDHISVSRISVDDVRAIDAGHMSSG